LNPFIEVHWSDHRQLDRESRSIRRLGGHVGFRTAPDSNNPAQIATAWNMGSAITSDDATAMSKSVKGNAVDPSIAEHNRHRRFAPRQEMPLTPCVLVLHEPIRDLEPIFESDSVQIRLSGSIASDCPGVLLAPSSASGTGGRLTAIAVRGRRHGSKACLRFLIRSAAECHRSR